MKLKNQILNKFFLILLLTGVFVGFLLMTDPNEVALALLVVPFVFLGVLFYQLASVVLLLTKTHKNSYFGKIVALSTATVAVGLLLLQSLNQLTWRDGFLTVLFTGLFWLYIWRADFLRP